MTRYCRKPDENYVYIYTDRLITKKGCVECDESGNILSSAENNVLTPPNAPTIADVPKVKESTEANFEVDEESNEEEAKVAIAIPEDINSWKLGDIKKFALKNDLDVKIGYRMKAVDAAEMVKNAIETHNESLEG